MLWDTAQEPMLTLFSHRNASRDNQVAAAIPDLRAPRFKSSRRWKPAVLANVSLAISELIIVVRKHNAFTDQVGIICPPVGVETVGSQHQLSESGKGRLPRRKSGTITKGR